MQGIARSEAAERTLEVREQREPMRIAANEPFSTDYQPPCNFQPSLVPLLQDARGTS
jgi:hypothetical protein